MAEYCVASDLRAAGRLNVTSNAYDAAITQMITAASRWIDRETWQLDDAFKATTSTKRYYLPGDIFDHSLHLDQPLLSVTTLTNGDGSVISSSAYRLHPRNSTPYWSIALKSTSLWMFTPDSEIEVDGVWGFSSVVPAAIFEATCMLAGWIYKRYQNALQDASVAAELGTMTYAEAMPKQVLSLIKTYRRGATL